LAAAAGLRLSLARSDAVPQLSLDAQDKASGHEWTASVPICVSADAFAIRTGASNASSAFR
jgi:uncharacterized membrane protein